MRKCVISAIILRYRLFMGNLPYDSLIHFSLTWSTVGYLWDAHILLRNFVLCYSIFETLWPCDIYDICNRYLCSTSYYINWNAFNLKWCILLKCILFRMYLINTFSMYTFHHYFRNLFILIILFIYFFFNVFIYWFVEMFHLKYTHYNLFVQKLLNVFIFTYLICN